MSQVSSELPFSALNFANIRVLLLLFLNPLEFRRAYFLCTQSWLTSRLAFSFSQAYIFHVCVSFFRSNFGSQHLAFALSTTGFFFRFLPSQKAITPASADAGSGASFAAFCKRCDAFGGQLHAIVRFLFFESTAICLHDL